MLSEKSGLGKNNKPKNKPNNIDQAENMLSLLSGKTHQVYTGVCLKWIENNIQQLFFRG